MFGALTIGALAFCDRGTSLPVLTGLLFAAGLSRSLNFTATNTLVFADITSVKRNDATTSVSVLQHNALSLGVGVAASLLAIASTARGEAQLAQDDFRLAFVAVALAMLASAIGYFVTLPSTAGDNLRA